MAIAKPAISSPKTISHCTPFGINPWILLGYYFVVCCLTGNVVSAAEPLKVLMRRRGIFSSYDDPEKMLADATNLGASVSIYTALIGGLLNDFVGPKITAVIGQLSSAVGFFLIFSAPRDSYFLVALGCSVLGATYACVSISHTSLAAVFPGKATLAISILCVGNDVSLSVPNILKLLGVKFNDGHIEYAVYGYCILCVFIAVLEVALVPAKPFKAPANPEEIKPLTDSTNKTDSAGKKSDTYKSAEPSRARPLDMTSWSLKEQMSHRVYWVITIVVCFSFFRKQYYMQLVRQINQTVAVKSGATMADGDTITNAFTLLLPTTSIGSFLTGALTTRFGAFFGVFLLNSYAVCLYLVTSIPVLRLQWAAILFYNLFGGFIFGLMYSYLGAFFGFDTMGTLQGALKLLCGTSGLLFTAFNTHVVKHLPDVIWSNRILLVASVAAYLVPLYLVYRPPEVDVAPTPVEDADVEINLVPPPSAFDKLSILTARGQNSYLGIVNAELDRSSIAAVSQDNRSALLKCYNRKSHF